MGDKVEDLVAAGATPGLELLGSLYSLGATPPNDEITALQEITGLTSKEALVHYEWIRANLPV